MTTPTPLSPAAQAVLDALEQNGQVIYGMPLLRPLVAAALHAAVDQVVPDEPRPLPGRVEPGGTLMHFHESFSRWEERQFARLGLQKIADELENFND